MKKWILLVIPTMLSACSTTPVQLKDAKLVPSDRALAFQVNDKGKPSLTVIRDEGIVGSGCYAGFYLNGTLAARVDVAEAATFYVEPGEILMRVGPDPQGKGLCGLQGPNWIQRETLMKGGERKLFRLKISALGEWDVIRAELAPETRGRP